MMITETLVVGQLQTNCYLFFDNESREAVIIDPGDDADFIINKLSALSLKPLAILATHAHFDHVLGVTELKLAFNIPFYLNAKDAKILARAQKTAKYLIPDDNIPFIDQPDGFLKNHQKIKVGKSLLQVMETPGHTQGSLSYLARACLPARQACLPARQGRGSSRVIFVGDVMFERGSWGRTDLEGGDEIQIKKSIKKVLSLPDKTIIYPGHGRQTTVKDEKNYY